MIHILYAFPIHAELGSIPVNFRISRVNSLWEYCHLSVATQFGHLYVGGDLSVVKRSIIMAADQTTMYGLRERPSNTPHVHFNNLKKEASPSRASNLQGKENIFPAPLDITSPRCWDWIIVEGSTHFARDRASFTSYKPIQPTANPAITITSTARPQVIGIGTVKLEVVTSPAPGAPTRTITLRNVLHMPTALFNGFCARRQGDIQSFDNPIQAWDKQGRPTWCTVEFWGWQRIVISGHSEGISPVREAMLRTGKEEKCLLAH